MKRTLLFLILVSLSLSFPRIYKRWTHAFRPSKCLVEWPYVPEWEIAPLSSEKREEIRALLNQPYSYLTKGAQSYVFLSQDQKYVLKLFRFDTTKAPFGQRIERQFRKWIGVREKHFIAKDVAIAKNFNSCKLAYNLAPKQTGLVFVHLNPGKDLYRNDLKNRESGKEAPRFLSRLCDDEAAKLKKFSDGGGTKSGGCPTPSETDFSGSFGIPLIHLKDRLGFSHKIDPALYRFILQKKAEPLRTTFYAHRDNLQPYIASYLKLLTELATAGLVNLDCTMGRNYGFLDGEAIQIDIGNFIYCPDQALENTVQYKEQLQDWLAKRIPEVDSEKFFISRS